MNALGAILVSLLVLVVLLRVRVKIGLSMVAAAVVLAVLLGVTPRAMGRQLASEWHAGPWTETTGYLFVSLTLLLLLVNVIGCAMTEIGISARLAPAMRGLFRSRRVALAAIPLMMGMLPTPGGIMLSAPMVREAGDEMGVSRSRLAAINFLFRHQWEPIWPLFPCFPYIQMTLGISAWQLVRWHLALPAAGIAGGVVFLLLAGIPPRKPDDGNAEVAFGAHIRDFMHAFWPIAFTAILYVVLDVPPAIGIFLAIVGLLLLHRVALKRWGRIFQAANEPDMVLLIFGALWFRLILDASGAVGSVVAFFAQIHMPPLLVVFLLPLLVSASTGVTIGTVAITYPFLMPYIRTADGVNLGIETLAFAGLVFGLSVSPVHLCLALSAKYFDASLARIVAKVLPVALCVAAAGLAVALVSR